MGHVITERDFFAIRVGAEVAVFENQIERPEDLGLRFAEDKALMAAPPAQQGSSTSRPRHGWSGIADARRVAHRQTAWADKAKESHD